jgi:hypothetical protein
LCLCDHALIHASTYFSKTIILANSLYSNYSIYPNKRQDFIFETKLLSNLSIYKIIWTYKVEWSHYLTNLYLVDIYKRISKTPLRKHSKGDAMSPLVSEKSTKALLFYLKFILYLTLA